MKKILLAFSAMIVATAGFSQLQINPQIGLNVMTLSDPPPQSEFSANVGYSIGADLRFGERFQIQPGAHWFHSSTAVETGEGEFEVKEDLVRQYVKLKAMAAYNLVDNGAFKLRINAGPTYDFLVNVDDGETFDKDNFNNGVFYIQGGLGVDILFLTGEIGYAQGLTNTFDGSDAPDSRDSGFYFTVGIVLGDGKK